MIHIFRNRAGRKMMGQIGLSRQLTYREVSHLSRAPVFWLGEVLWIGQVSVPKG